MLMKQSKGENNLNNRESNNNNINISEKTGNKMEIQMERRTSI